MTSFLLSCGDARALPLRDASIDAVVCDPPYGTEAGVGNHNGGYGRRELWGAGGLRIEGDADLTSLTDALPEILRVVRPDAWLAFFISPRKQLEARLVLAGAGLDLYGEIVWDKREAGLGHPIRYSHESVIICRVGNPPTPSVAILSSHVARAPFRTNRGHPHEKPVSLLRLLIAFCCPLGGTVLDPFAGSGSTGVAAILEGRTPILVELTQGWADVARKRCRFVNPASDPSTLFHELGESA